MKNKKGKILLVLFIIVVTIALHFLHYAIFHDLHHLMIYLVGDIAFVPLEVLLVSLVFDRLIEAQSHNEKRRKAYMLVEVFYMEIGNKLLKIFSNIDQEITESRESIKPGIQWEQEDFRVLKHMIINLKHQVDMNSIDLKKLNELLQSKKEMMVNFITNSALTEHGGFSDSIIATFHLLDELEARELENLTVEDSKHLKVDIERAYKWLARDWVDYMEHLKKEYPFLYNRAIETNPFIG